MTFNDLYNSYIKLDNNWFKINNSTNLIQTVGVDGFYLLANLIYYTGTYRNYVCFNREYISSIFNNNKQRGFATANLALKNLVYNNIIKLDNFDIDNMTAGGFYRAKLLLPDIEKNYFTIPDVHLETINNCTNINKPKLLTIYSAIKSKMYNDNYAIITYDELALETKIPKSSIGKFIKILSDKNIIVFGNAGKRYFEHSKQYKDSPNIYVLGTEFAPKVLSQALKIYKNEQEFKGVRFI